MEETGIVAVHRSTILGRNVSIIEVSHAVEPWFGIASDSIIGVCTSGRLRILLRLIRRWLLGLQPDNAFQNGTDVVGNI